MSKNAVITGLGYYVPPKILTNYDLSKMVDTSNTWIVERTGIERRHIAEKDVFTSDLAAAAAKNALASAKLSAQDIDFIIVTTLSPDMFTPSASCMVQEKLGISGCPCMDLNAACTGFIYGLSVATSFIQSGMYERILVVGAESMSKLVDWKDRSTCVLFGDGAGAAVVCASDEDYGVQKTFLGADGASGRCLTILNQDQSEEEMAKRISKIPSTLYMDGSEVFKFAVKTMSSASKHLMEMCGKTTDDIDLLIPHQANVRILESARKRLKLSEDKVMNVVKDFGNISSACIPIALCEASAQGRIKDGDNVVLVGFGGGLTWASALIKWKEIK